jgi:hypothetical protein
VDGRLEGEGAGVGVGLDFASLFLSVEIGFCGGVDGWDEVEMGETFLRGQIVWKDGGGGGTLRSAMGAKESGFAES